MIRGKLLLLLLVTSLAVAVHADYKQNLKNRKLMTEEPIPVGYRAVKMEQVYFPFDENFDSASFRDELANAIGVPVDSVRIMSNLEKEGRTVPLRVLEVAIIDLTTAQETEVIDFCGDNQSEFTLPGFGSLSYGGCWTLNSWNLNKEVSEPDDIVTLIMEDVCTSVPATGIPDAQTCEEWGPCADYNAAFKNALASTASVTTGINFILENADRCDDATLAGTTQVSTTFEVRAADLGAVLDLLPTASSTIDLGGDFGVISLGDDLTFLD